MADFIQESISTHYDTLTRTFQLYLRRAGLVDNYSFYELINDVTLEAAKHSERWTHNQHSPAWLISIGTNLIKRKQAELHKQRTREPLVRDLLHASASPLSDGELFDSLAQVGQVDPTADFEKADTARYWLSLLAPDDREIVQLAILNEMSSELVAEELGIAPGTARMRLHRALKRLKLALTEVVLHE